MANGEPTPPVPLEDEVFVYAGEIWRVLAKDDEAELLLASSGQSTSRAGRYQKFDYDAAAQAHRETWTPTVDWLEPRHAHEGDDDVTLRVRGTGFTPESQVLLNGDTSPAATTYVDPTTLEVTVPATQATTLQVAVQNLLGSELLISNGNGVNDPAFTVVAPEPEPEPLPESAWKRRKLRRGLPLPEAA